MRRILLCVTGLSPQIVTETIYALAVRPARGRSPWIPDEVHLITTTRGADNARLQLLHPSTGWFHRLIQDYQLPPIVFSDERIHLIVRPDGTPLEDIRDDDDNRLAADCIADLVRRLTEPEDTEVHASIAGGRKTMGFFLGYAMSLYGRPQDRLSHVLVNPPFENSPDFYYPTPHAHVVRRHDRPNEVFDASKAEVWLGDIPFVRLRTELDARTRERTQSAFSDAVQSVQESLTPSQMMIEVANRTVRIGRFEILLSPIDLAFLLWMVERARRGKPVTPPKLSDGPRGSNRDHDAEEFLAIYQKLLTDPDEHETRTHTRLRTEGLTLPFFRERMSRLRERFEKVLGEARARDYVVRREGPRGQPIYRLAFPADRIEVIESPPQA